MRTLTTLTALTLSSSALAAPQDITLTVGGVTLSGTLELPSGPGPHPVALVISGSGPTDRDGNSLGLPGKNDSLKTLAQGLAARGIATVRYDKRGIAASPTSQREEDLRFDDFVNDAVAWLELLRADPRFSGVSVIGHSEGSLVGTVAARKTNVRALVSLAGPGDDLGATVMRQLRANPANPPALVEESERILAELRAGRRVENVPALLAPLFRPSVQPFLISQLKYDPARELAALEIPVLIVIGDRDLQVAVNDARLLKAALPAATLAVVPGMNHVLADVGADLALNQRSYVDATVPQTPALAPTIANFLLESVR